MDYFTGLGENSTIRVNSYAGGYVTIEMNVDHIKDGLKMELFRVERKIDKLGKEFKNL